MKKILTIAAVATLSLVSALPAHARKDGGPMSPQHMSQQGRESTNNPLMGQQKGQDRAMERMNDSAIDHRMSGAQDGRGNARGHDKDLGGGKGRGKAKGHDR